MSALDEKRKSLSNSKSDVLDARVVANYGDPGLDEDYHFDFLSRYVVVMLESSFRVPSLNKWAGLFAIVKRPTHLWITAEEGKSSSPNTQKRADSIGNISVGVAGSFSSEGVPRINEPYQLGELIKIKKLAAPERVTESSLFISAFSEGLDSYLTYNSWHTEGSTLSYFAGNQTRIDSIKFKTLFQPFNDPFVYGVRLFKYQYEAFFLTLASQDNNLYNYGASIFDNTLPSSDPVYNANGGYVFKNVDYIDLIASEFEDLNIGNKQRTSTSECLPLIVTTPNSFPTPRTRAVGTISYNPSYSPISVTS